MADKLGKAEAAARQAISRAPKLGSAFAVLAAIEAERFEFVAAVQDMRRALALSPDDPSVISGASNFMGEFGDLRKALDLANKAIDRDPFLGINHVNRGLILFVLKQFPAAIADYLKAIELAPKVIRFHAFIGDCLLLMNRPQEAKLQYATQPADDALRLTGEAMIAMRSRDLGTTERIIAHMRELFGDAASYQYAQIYAQGSNSNHAFAELDNAVHVKDPGLLALATDPFLDPIRGDPRYPALLKRLNFPHWT
jgi:tetratricopeptide (TPR) repeat protein